MNNIIAITVTFNSSKFVIRAIEALLMQTVKVNKIIVVDNNSSEKEKKNLNSYVNKCPNVILITLKENLGGAGGFQAGMKYANNVLHPDWFWLMDDDAFPESDCLEKLLKEYNVKDNIGCLVPLIWGVDKQQYQLYHHKKESKYLTKDIQAVCDVDCMDTKVKIESSAFVGPLISKDAVNSVGIADGSLFIYGDDLEYIYRISRKFDVYLIKNAVINHQDIMMKGNIVDPKSWWKDYYQYRNRIFFIKKYAKGINRIIGIMIFSAFLIKKCLAAFLKKDYRLNIKLRIWIVTTAWKDGLKGKRGKTIDPVIYSKEISNK